LKAYRYSGSRPLAENTAPNVTDYPTAGKWQSAREDRQAPGENSQLFGPPPGVRFPAPRVAGSPDCVVRDRKTVFPWLYSREKVGTDYDYWGVCFRLIGLEKQVFAGEEKKRLWLFFVFKLPLA